MADTEVENVLREIRERVRAESASSAPLSTSVAAREGVAQHAANETSEALARMEANLATTERAWNRLPPLVSNRTGWVARLELWLKRLLKRAAHWFTWEQVNFNSAAHHALRDALSALSVYEKQLAEARADAAATRTELAALHQSHDKLALRMESEGMEQAALRQSHDKLVLRMESESTAEKARLTATEKLLAKTEARLAEAENLLSTSGARFAETEKMTGTIEARLAAAEAHLSETAALFDTEIVRFHDALAAAIAQLREEEQALAGNLIQLRDEQRALAAAASAERETRLIGLQKELHERAEHLREELRVSFKQLSLEAGETAVMQDRARRQIEARLETIEKKV